MGHRNTQFAGHLIETDTDQQDHSHLHPEPWIYYGNLPTYPQPNFNNHPVPEHHGNALFYGIPHHNVMPPQHHPSTNLDLAVGAPSTHYHPYLAPPPYGTIRDFPIQGAHEQFPHYNRNIHYIDDIGGAYKRKIAEGFPANFQYHASLAGPSSSAAPMAARPAENDITPSIVGPDSVVAHNGGHLVQGTYVASPVQLHGNHLMDTRFGASIGDIGSFPWTPAPNIPYMHANVNGACLEAGNMGMQGYQITASNRSANGFMHPPIPQGHPANPHHPNQPIQGGRGYSIGFPPQVAASSHRIPSSSNTGINNAFQNAPEAGPTFLAPVAPAGFRVYGHGHHRRELVIDSNSRNRSLRHLRVLPEDEVAILEIPGYHEAVDSMDQHREMRLDIDHMSYEELLALGEHIGSVGTGLSEEFIQNNLKTRSFTSSADCANLDEPTSPDQRIDFCVICQTDYVDEETVGTLDCGHEYHTECVKKWLKMKNTCPVCKSTALTGKGKD